MQEKYLEDIADQEARASASAPSAAPSHNRCATSSLTSSVELVLSRVVAAVAIRFTPLKTISQRVVHGIVEGMNYASHNSFAPFFLCGNAPSVVSRSMTPKPGALKIVSDMQQQQHEHQARLRCDIQRVARDVLESVVRHAAVRASEMHAAIVDALEQQAEQLKAAENTEIKPEIILTEAPSAAVIVEAEPVADCSDEPCKQPLGPDVSSHDSRPADALVIRSFSTAPEIGRFCRASSVQVGMTPARRCAHVAAVCPSSGTEWKGRR